MLGLGLRRLVHVLTRPSLKGVVEGYENLLQSAPFIGHWGWRDREITAQLYDPKNA